MKYLLSLFIALFVAGCQQNVTPIPTPQPQQPPKAEPKKAEPPPPVPDTQPPLPTNPTVPFMTGYHDGYYGRWLAPIRWTALNEYRHGWAAGAYDRKHGLPNRFDHKKE